jgi:hypothetical protein
MSSRYLGYLTAGDSNSRVFRSLAEHEPESASLIDGEHAEGIGLERTPHSVRNPSESLESSKDDAGCPNPDSY